MSDPESGLDSSGVNGGAAETSVKVTVRIRPLVGEYGSASFPEMVNRSMPHVLILDPAPWSVSLGQEVLHGSRSCLNVVGSSTVSAFDKSFDFDHVLRPDTTQKRAYEVTTRPLIDQYVPV